MKTEQPFTTLHLPTGGYVKVFPVKGKHYFSALRAGITSTIELTLYFIERTVELDGKLITQEQLEEMDVSDVVLIFDTLSAQLTTVKDLSNG